jgi:hypothetical protein
MVRREKDAPHRRGRTEGKKEVDIVPRRERMKKLYEKKIKREMRGRVVSSRPVSSRVVLRLFV